MLTCLSCKNFDKFEPMVNTYEEEHKRLIGTHGDGIGYNPNGFYCGACNKATCVGCDNANRKDE